MSDHILNYLTPRQRKARTEAFKYMAYKWRQKEKESGKKVSKNVRRRICLEMDLEIFSGLNVPVLKIIIQNKKL